MVSGSGLYSMIWGPVQSGLSFSVHFKEAVRYVYDDVCLYMVCVCGGEQVWRVEDHLVMFSFSPFIWVVWIELRFPSLHSNLPLPSDPLQF